MHQVDDGGEDNGPRFPLFGSNQKPKESPLRPETRIGDGGHGKTETAPKGPNLFSRLKESFVRREPAFHEERPKVSNLGAITWQILSTVISAAFVVATLFSLWMPGTLLENNLQGNLANALISPEETTTPNAIVGEKPADFPADKIGIVVGHRGNDTGAVCTNGLTELEINSNIASYLQQKLVEDGYTVELLDEFDPRLSNYEAPALISIHADSCDYVNDSATGFKVAAALSSKDQESTSRLVSCLSDRYASITGLRYHYQSVTPDMTYYHAFTEINPYTTAAIIEVGFMNLDQEILTLKPDLLAEGIQQGLLCYLKGEKVNTVPTEAETTNP